ncbi:hypothetical protein LXA47_19200 [Massilia sp. P8910]|nr:hypothetical protein [Massilia antarctica]MCE3605715.1 hypothetical protein [Massilia antarctica]
MKQFLSATVLTAASGLVVVLDQHPIGALAFIAVLLILIRATVPPKRK